MNNIMTEPVVIRRIPPVLADAATRIGLSLELGIDADLITGSEYDIPETLSEQQRRDALLACFTEDYTRREALADMVTSGFLPLDDLNHAAAHLTVMASVLDEIEDEDNRSGFEPEAMAWGWAA
ncbi:hypothetical protein AB0K09_03595 [Streptomyces sp. NPDC049577]|uniref:hypothetical protein n=1 Tax=Streptomyces sp. NPDC049577 TaxID=3155153 RepID=UPI0034151D0D